MECTSPAIWQLPAIGNTGQKSSDWVWFPSRIPRPGYAGCVARPGSLSGSQRRNCSVLYLYDGYALILILFAVFAVVDLTISTNRKQRMKPLG